MPHEQWEELLDNSEDEEKTIQKVFKCYLMVVENKNQKNFVLFFKPELGV